MPHDPPVAREQLRYLRGVIRQVGPALFSLYLQRRLQSRAGVADRARISRELHDGVIQALIGIEMQLEALRREAAGKVPDAARPRSWPPSSGCSARRFWNVRDLMRLLKPEEVDARRLVEHLADMVERFRHRTGIEARLVCDADEIDLTPRACREVAGIVQEALANVRKHSGATSVVVRLERSGVDWKLAVDDNGCGLDFEGHLTQEELDAQRKGPVIIKERVRAIGGSLTLRSQRGLRHPAGHHRFHRNTMPERSTPIRIVIADDHPIFRDGLRRLLDADPRFDVVGEAGDGSRSRGAGRGAAAGHPAARPRDAAGQRAARRCRS